MSNLKRAVIALGVAMGLVGCIGLAACGDTTDDGHAHVYNWATEKAATCTEPGTQKGTCAVDGCKSVETREISALGHDLDKTETTPAKCGEKGVLHVSCKRGDFEDNQEIPALEHRFGDWTNRQAATCTTPETGTHMCLLCKQSFPGEISPALGHNIKDGKIIEEATCTAEGSMTGYCTRCKTEYDEDNPAVIFAKGHKLPATGKSILKAATCTETGIYIGECTVCGQEATEEIPITDHVWDTEYKLDVAPTYNTVGRKSIHCKNCSITQNPIELDKLVQGQATDHEFRLVNRAGKVLDELSPTVALVDANGNPTEASFKNGKCTVKLVPGTYVMNLIGLPNGYTASEYTVEEGYIINEVTVQTSVISGTAPIGTRYQVGSVMYDFTVTDTDGNTYKLSELTQQYKLVMLNFWSTYCGPCRMEFPYMEQAYQEYKDDVFIVAIGISFQGIIDSREDIRNFKKENGLSFPMANYQDAGKVSDCFYFQGVPTTILISPDGVVLAQHESAILSKAAFTSMWDQYISTSETRNLSVQSEKILSGVEYLPGKELEF